MTMVESFIPVPDTGIKVLMMVFANWHTGMKEFISTLVDYDEILFWQVLPGPYHCPFL